MNQRYDYVEVKLPHVELKKFKAIMRALGFSIVEKSEIDEAIEEVESGHVYSCPSVNALMKLIVD